MGSGNWFTVAQFVLTLSVGVLTGTIYRAFKAGRWVQSVDQRTDEIERINTRLDKAGAEMSDIASDVQGLPDRMRTVFVSREVFEAEMKIVVERRAEVREDIERLWNALRFGMHPDSRGPSR